ncbi:MAG: SCP2 sterol-binding domain-containing protein [Lachnospiraceae bacterium]|jgi:putative sterol carrier protein|nr:SCP2 sterol-binding domain-containing protein [Lachnospiraceae bacterium]MEE3460519.1 SCP2 sterol-binding domain-containing protein [Lachnospiraceae bacterium]
MQRINIYYGGRGLIDDPLLYVLDTITKVLTELNCDVERINFYEDKSKIASSPSTLKTCDAVILAVSSEWFGMGGNMLSFLDACWLYGDRGVLKCLKMLPVVIATAPGEKDIAVDIMKAWEILGGISVSPIAAYVANRADFEADSGYKQIIEKRIENFYREIGSQIKVLPSSNAIAGNLGVRPKSMELTPQESEQLSKYVSDDKFVKKQKEDIKELTEIFKGMLPDDDPANKADQLLNDFRKRFKGVEGTSFQFAFTDVNKSIYAETEDGQVTVKYGQLDSPDVLVKISREDLKDILDNKATLQGSFLSGKVSSKGEFKLLKKFDEAMK